jgi:hypothetical protein
MMFHLLTCGVSEKEAAGTECPCTHMCEEYNEGDLLCVA